VASAAGIAPGVVHRERGAPPGGGEFPLRTGTPGRRPLLLSAAPLGLTLLRLWPVVAAAGPARRHPPGLGDLLARPVPRVRGGRRFCRAGLLRGPGVAHVAEAFGEPPFHVMVRRRYADSARRHRPAATGG